MQFANPFANPETNISKLSLQPGMKVTDLGAGSGAYSLALARRLIPSGKVYSVDVQKDLLARLSDLARGQGISNIETIWGDLDKPGGSKIADRKMDAAVASNILFQLKNADIFAKEVSRILKPGGELLLVDWEKGAGALSPPDNLTVNPLQARSLFEKNGFVHLKNFEAGSHHWGMILKKQ